MREQQRGVCRSEKKDFHENFHCKLSSSVKIYRLNTIFSFSPHSPSTHFLSTRLDSSNFHTFYTHLLRMSDNDANLCVSFPCHTSRVDILNFLTQIWIWDFLSVQKKKRNVGRQTSKKEQRVSVNFSWDLNEIRHTAKEKYFHSCSHARMRIEFCFLFCLVSWRRLALTLSYCG